MAPNNNNNINSNINKEFFPRTTVINLPWHTKRKHKIIQEFKSNNIPFAFMKEEDVVDGKKFMQVSSQSESKSSQSALIQSKVTPLARWFSTPGMIGCFLSHQKCWEDCVASNEPLLIFEDDVVLSSNFKEVVIAIMKKVGNDGTSCSSNSYGNDGSNSNNDANDSNLYSWDVILLGALGCVRPDKKFGFNWIPSLVGGKWRKTRHVANILLDDAKDDTGGDTSNESNDNDSDKRSDETNMNIVKSYKNHTLHVPMCPYGCHAYILSPKGASKLLSNCKRASFHVDAVAWGILDLNLFAIHPLIAKQTNEDTTLGGGSDVYQKIHDKIGIFPYDDYTGLDIGKGLSAPLIRVGGPLPLFQNLLLTNGISLVIMSLGLVIGSLIKSKFVLVATLSYVIVVAMMVRILAATT
jgi:GR25 family glycosyltransferase involved in LPS biosynthesis